MDLQNPPIHLPDNIRYLRKKMQLSQEELAHRVGLNRGNIASYEKGTAEPKICNLLKLAYVFEVSVRDLTEKPLRQLNGSFVSSLQKGRKLTQTVDLLPYIQQAEELQTVVGSLYNCHCFKVKNIDAENKDVQVLASNFEQLYEVTHRILESHQQLVKIINNQS